MNALIFGRRKQGKSTLALRLCMSLHRTVFIFDPNSQFLGLETVEDIDGLKIWMDEDHEHGIIVYRPTPGSIEDEFEELADALWPLGNYGLLLDESSGLQTSNSMCPALERLMRQAPRDGTKNRQGAVVDVTVVQTLHRPKDAHSLCRSLTTDQFFFQTKLRTDLDVIERQFGPDLAAAVPQLPRFHVAHTFTDLEGKDEFSIWRKPEQWFVGINDLQS